MTLVFFILIFGLVVIAHEFGHFLLAKTNGIRVTEFAIGMGPKLLHFKKGETEYCLRLLPIGGACVFDNENELGGTADKEYEEGAFPAANVWARISTVVAGPIFNFILGFLIAFVLVLFFLLLLLNTIISIRIIFENIINWASIIIPNKMPSTIFSKIIYLTPKMNAYYSIFRSL